MLWTEKYRPDSFEKIRGQTEVIGHIKKFAEEKNVPHMIFFGPHGNGKSCAVECLAKSIYGDDAGLNVTVIPAGTLFRQGKTWLEKEYKYSHLYKSENSLIANFKHIVKWYASMKPFNAEFRIIVFEDAGELTFDAQAALRRIMEKYSRTCRFILIARQQTAIIPPIASRCLPLFFSPLDSSDITACLNEIIEKEGITGDVADGGNVELIAKVSEGDLRKATLFLEAFVSKEDADILDLTNSEVSAIAYALFATIRNKDLKKSCEIAEMMMLEYGLSGREVIAELKEVVKREYNDEYLTVILSDTDFSLCTAQNEYLQINAMIARIITEVFDSE